MKKRNFKAKALNLKKQSISNLKSSIIVGGSRPVCRPHSVLCPKDSFDNECYWSKGQADYKQNKLLGG